MGRFAAFAPMTIRSFLPWVIVPGGPVVATSRFMVQLARNAIAALAGFLVTLSLHGAVTNTWYASNSPIVVTTNVNIISATTLVIEAGTTVQFGAGINLVVANGGVLLAEGNSNAPIQFTRSGVSGFWGSITINGAVGSPESRITYATFDFNANSTAIPCIDVNAGTAFLDHLVFKNAGAPYIHIDGASFMISECYFPTPSAAFEPCHGVGGVKSGGRGIFLRNFFGKPNGYNDVVDFSGGNRNFGQPIVQFLGNVFTGSDDDGLDLDGTDAWVEGNIFLHIHRNGNTPDSASPVSGGGSGSDLSEITVLRNIFFDCDQAGTAKEGNFFTFLNNTIIHQTHVGGIDPTGAVVALGDAGAVSAAGNYLEGNVIYDIEQLTRFLTTAVVTFTNNILPVAWAGPGGNNTIANPLFKHVPTLAETVFTNWAQAQVMWDWLSLQTNSPGIGTGPNGTDKGAIIPHGVSLFGVPSGATNQSNATIVVGINRKGSGIPTAGFPLGSGYTHYQWRLDTNLTWSAETPIATPITLSNLVSGPHHIEVIGKNDASFYQNDAAYGSSGGITLSPTWTIGAADTDGDGIPDSWESAYGLNPTNAADANLDGDGDGMKNLQEYLAGTNPTNALSRLALMLLPAVSNSIVFQFSTVSNKSYTVEYRDSLSTGMWLRLQDYIAVSTNRMLSLTNALGGPMRFYQVVTPQLPP